MCERLLVALAWSSGQAFFYAWHQYEMNDFTLTSACYIFEATAQLGTSLNTKETYSMFICKIKKFNITQSQALQFHFKLKM